MKRLILHIGKLKTGTSAIQHSLFNARHALRKSGVYYPDISPPNHSVTFWLAFEGYQGIIDSPLHIKKLIKQGKYQSYKSVIKEYEAMWLREINNNTCNTFIISAELMSMMTQENIYALKIYMEKFFDQVTIIEYIRDFKSAVSSLVQQQIKSCYKALSIAEQIDTLFCNKHEKRILLSKTIDGWIKVFGRENIIIRPFDATVFKNNDLIDDFFYSLGINIDTSPIARNTINVSLGNNAVEFLAEFNNKYPCLVDNKINNNRGSSSFPFPASVFIIDEDEKFTIEIEHLKKEYIDTLNDDINWINSFFEHGYKFENIEQKVAQTKHSSLNKIPTSFFVELTNNFLKELEYRLSTIENYKETIKRYKAANERYKKRNTELQSKLKQLKKKHS